jgi:hypothetical protein
MTTLLVIDALLLAGLVFFKSRPVVRWCCVYILISPLPITFIQQRGGTALYLPLFGWALLIGTLLGTAIQTASPSLVWPHRRISAPAVRIYLVAALSFGWVYETARQWGDFPAAYIQSQEQTWATMLALKASTFRPKSGSRVLFLRDPFTDWRMVFIAQLVWNDHSVFITTAHMMPSPPTPAEIATYDTLLKFENGSLELASAAGP